MGNLFTSLLNSSSALRAYSQALQVVQNDVTNASTPGYVKQVQTFRALPFDVSVGFRAVCRQARSKTRRRIR